MRVGEFYVWEIFHSNSHNAVRVFCVNENLLNIAVRDARENICVFKNSNLPYWFQGVDTSKFFNWKSIKLQKKVSKSILRGFYSIFKVYTKIRCKSVYPLQHEQYRQNFQEKLKFTTLFLLSCEAKIFFQQFRLSSFCFLLQSLASTPSKHKSDDSKMLVCIFSIHTQKNRKKLNIIPFRNVVMKTQHEKIFLYVCLCCLWRVSTAWEIENCEKRILCQKYGSFMRERVFIKIKQLSFIMCSVECARLVIIAVDFKKDAFNGHSWWRWMGII